MRIISGKHKSRRLTAPKNLPVRPTTDMAKESLFNILNNTYYFDSISVIDLFSCRQILQSDACRRNELHCLREQKGSLYGLCR